MAVTDAIAAVAPPVYRWIAVSARTGRRIASLPGLVCGSVGVVLGGETTVQATLPLTDRTPPNWEEAVLEGAACLVLVDASDENRPVWGGWVVASERTEADAVALTLVTWEHLLDRVYVGDLVRTATSQTAIMAALAAIRQDGTVPLLVEAAASATLRDRAYADEDDKTVLAAMSELMDVQGGPEFTVEWRHLTDPERFVPVLRIADRIGVSPVSGLRPAATFRLPGDVASFTDSRSFARDSGANHVVATSNPDPGDQDAPRPQSPPQVYADALRPVLQERFTPSTSITDVSTLVAHAAARLALRQGGSHALALSASVQSAPRLGRTWGIGDDLGYKIAAPSVGTAEGVARCLGWTLDLSKGLVTPVLGVPRG